MQVKDNQKNLRQDIEDWCAYAQQLAFKDISYDYARTVNKGHGRIEIRECWVIDDPLAFEYIRHHLGWKGLKTIAMLRRKKRIGDKVTEETVYYISSLASDAKLILTCSRIRLGDAPQNFAVLRRIALNLLKQEHSVKRSVRAKRMRVALDDDYLHKVLTSV